MTMNGDGDWRDVVVTEDSGVDKVLAKGVKT